MKKILLVLLSFLSITTFAQESEWIPFEWKGGTVSGRYFAHMAMTVPVTIDDLPHRFSMQLDLGAVNTMIYGNTIEAYFASYEKLANKIDTTLSFWAQGRKNPKFRDMKLKLGSTSFGRHNIGYFKGFGGKISRDSIHLDKERHIGTIGPDLFSDKILIIDYPNQRFRLVEELPKEFNRVDFQPFKMKNGRIKIPLTINGELEDLLFDTGSSMFALLTTEEKANQISKKKVVDSLEVSSWGSLYTVYGQKVNSSIKLGKKKLASDKVFYDKVKKLDQFYDYEKIWGITGNAYFLKNIVVIDYKSQQFGIK